jgi:hypothetical protein
MIDIHIEKRAGLYFVQVHSLYTDTSFSVRFLVDAMHEAEMIMKRDRMRYERAATNS